MVTGTASSFQVAHPIAGVRRKLLRAERHLKDVSALVQAMARTRSMLIPEPSSTPDVAAFRLALPPIPDDLVLAVGDCIHNLRCVLDHVVSQIADVYAPSRSQVEKRQSMFPLCSTRDEFKRQVARGRLRNLPSGAIKVVERAQPYHRRYALLGVLDALENIDKHRALVLVAAVSYGLSSEAFGQQKLQLPYDPDWFRDGTIVLELHRKFTTDDFDQIRSKPIAAWGSCHVMFGETDVQGRWVESTLSELTSLIGTLVVEFRPFLDPKVVVALQSRGSRLRRGTSR